MKRSQNDEAREERIMMEIVVDVSAEALQAIEDWKYWVAMGYQF